MRQKNPDKLTILTGLLILMYGLSLPSFSQNETYKVLSRETELGVGYVNVGVLGRNTGTVTDESGNFNLGFTEINDNDSLRFSMIGYESRTLSAGQLRRDSSKTVFIRLRTYGLPELRVTFPRGREIMLGSPVRSSALKSGFENNNLGSELGVRVIAKKRIKLKDIHFNVGVCTFDTVIYRLNVYQQSDKGEWVNLLKSPVYITFTKDQIGAPITYDLKEITIIFEGVAIVALEHFRDLGEGKLLFLTQFFTGTTYHRKSKEATWIQAPGQVGMYVHGQILN